MNAAFVDHFRKGTSGSQQLNTPVTSWVLLIESWVIQEAIHSGRQDSGSSLVIPHVQGPWRHEEGTGRGLGSAGSHFYPYCIATLWLQSMLGNDAWP